MILHCAGSLQPPTLLEAIHLDAPNSTLHYAASAAQPPALPLLALLPLFQHRCGGPICNSEYCR